MGESEIINKLTEHDEQFKAIDKRFDMVDERLDVIDERLDKNDEQHISIIKKLIEHDQRFDHLEHKIDYGISNLRNEILTGIDKILVYAQRLDQERIMGNNRVDRVEAKTDQNSADIVEIKRYIKMN